MIYLNVEMEGLHKIEADLGMMKDKSKYALRAAINSAAKQINDSMVSGAYKKYQYMKSKKDISGANKIMKAKVGSLQGKITASGPVNELLSFRVQPPTYFPGSVGAPRWIKAKALRNAPYSKIALRPQARGDKYKGFVVRYRNGHMALAQRVPGVYMKKYQPREEKGKNGRKSKGREALKSLLSSSVPKMEAVIYGEQIDREANDILAECIREQVERFLGGKKK